MKYILLVLSAMMLIGCDSNPPRYNDIKNENGEVRKYSEYSIYIIDGCQYVFYYQSLAHKGNCTNKIHIYNK